MNKEKTVRISLVCSLEASDFGNPVFVVPDPVAVGVVVSPDVTRSG
jgi:hypothetical protein